MKALRAYFDGWLVQFRPAHIRESRAMAVPYIDARTVQDRLDAVFGVTGWQDEYEVLPDGNVMCRLSLLIDGEWITRADVGGLPDDPDMRPGDRRKAAFSDALKRAAVKFGVGRYLYQIPPIWADWDPVAKRFSRQPSLPLRFLGGETPAVATPEPAASAPAPDASKQAAPAKSAKPGRVYLDEVKVSEAALVQAGKCQPGDLVRYLRKQGQLNGHGTDVWAWTPEAITFARTQAAAFSVKCNAIKS